MTIPKIHLVIVDSKEVDANESNYNSNFHTEKEAPHHTIPSEIPQSFKRWLPLISKSQNIPSATIQTITLSPSQGRLLIEAAQTSLHTREPNRLLSEELSNLEHAFSSLVFPSEGLFLRLDACSPKDGVRGVMPLRSIGEIILRITTSHRGTNSILRLLERKEDINFFFLPYNSGMDTSKEFRVFCAPPDGRITGVSQYKWHKPSVFMQNKSEEDVQQLVATAMKGILVAHGEMLAEARTSTGGEMDVLLLKQGFTFDVMFDEKNGRCGTIELNSFGSRSGCGSCLFHWLGDEDILYGKEEVVEFRVSC